MRLPTILTISIGLCAAWPAVAQTPPPAATSTATFVCPTTDVMKSPMAAQLRELALKPGGKIEPSVFMKDPKTAEFVGQIMQQDQARKQIDYSGLCRYRADNAVRAGGQSPRVILLGDSITENWRYGDPAFFSDRIIDRGISGQTSSQILLRFYADVIALHPAVVHIMAGTNDILQNAGPVNDEDIVNNINAMIDLAKARRIKVVLASILPISVRSWQPDLKPEVRILKLNKRLRTLAKTRGIVFADYYASLRNAPGDFNPRLANDGVHPNRDGYAVMKSIATAAIASAQR